MIQHPLSNSQKCNFVLSLAIILHCIDVLQNLNGCSSIGILQNFDF